MRHLAHKLKRILLLLIPAFSSERISLIARKTSRKIGARSWLVRTGHPNFITVVKLRHTSGRQHKCVRQFKTGYGCALLAHDATIIVAAEQCDEDVWFRVEIIFRQGLGNLIEVLAFREGVANWIEQRKIEQRIKTRISAVTHHATLKVRRMDHVSILHFTDHGEFWILAFDCCSPLAPKSIRHVLPGVHANAVKPAYANPPQRVLNQVARYLRIVLIQIGKKIEEPALH